MARILVIQLGRLGDVIQTTPLLKELLAQNFNGSVDVLVFETLREIVDGLGLGTVHVFSKRALPANLNQLDKNIERSRKRSEPFPHEAQEALRNLALPSYDRIVNCSYSPLGAFVARETRSECVIGPTITDGGEVLFHHPAQIYLRAHSSFRDQNWFNLVDLWRASGDPRRALSRNSLLHVPIDSALPFEIPSGRIVALNPGSNDSLRRWAPFEFAQLAEGLVSHGLVPALVGAPTDREACAEVQARSAVKIPNFCGKTTVPQLAFFLTHAELLVSNDTGAIHVAAAAGCRVLALFGATAYFAETAPWAEGNVILQGPLGSDVVVLSPQLVLATALKCLGLIDERDLRHEIALNEASGWETFFLAPDSDSLGGLSYRPLHGGNFSSEQTFTRELRHLFARVFADAQPTTGVSGLRPKSGSSSKPSSIRQGIGFDADVARFVNALESMAGAADRCGMLCSRPTQRGAAEISSLSAGLIHANEALKTSAERHPMVKPVVHFLDWSCHMMEPMAPEATFQAHAQAYRLAARLLRDAQLRMEAELEVVSAATC